MTPEREKLFHDNVHLVALIIKSHFKPGAYGCEMDDLMNIGRMGLWKAAETYDASTGYKFSTWAHWKIRGEIQGGRRPYGHSQYEHLKGRWNHVPLSQLESKFGTGHLADQSIVEAADDREPDDEQRAYELHHSVHEALKYLEPMEAKVITMRMEGGTLESIGDEIGCSGERVRQIELKAKRRLRLNQQLRDQYYKL